MVVFVETLCWKTLKMQCILLYSTLYFYMVHHWKLRCQFFLSGLSVDPRVQSKSITRLELKGASIWPERWGRLSASLPNLRQLVLNNCDIKRKDVTDMPDSVLDNLTFIRNRETPGKIRGVLFFIMDDIGGGNYKKIKKDEFQTYDGDKIEYRVVGTSGDILMAKEESFKRSNNSGEYVCLGIRCRYVRTITLTCIDFTNTCAAHPF